MSAVKFLMWEGREKAEIAVKEHEALLESASYDVGEDDGNTTDHHMKSVVPGTKLMFLEFEAMRDNHFRMLVRTKDSREYVLFEFYDRGSRKDTELYISLSSGIHAPGIAVDNYGQMELDFMHSNRLRRPRAEAQTMPSTTTFFDMPPDIPVVPMPVNTTVTHTTGGIFEAVRTFGFGDISTFNNTSTDAEQL